MAISYATLPDGRIGLYKEEDVELTRRPSFPSKFFIRGYLIDPDKDDQFYVVEAIDVRIVDRWFDLARDVAKEKNVPHMWILAMIYAESRGNPSAEAPDGGWGLMQITHPGLKKGYTKAQVFEPETNLRIGAGVVASYLRANPETNSLPEAASIYNAGGTPKYRPHPSEVSPWGMRETAGHISRVVAANNGLISFYEAGVCRP